MHTSIIYFQNLLTDQPKPQIITPSQTKHRHIHRIHLETIPQHYKLVHNLSLYNKRTKRCSGGTILAVHTAAYIFIEPLQVPLQHHLYLAIALIIPKSGSDILVITAYLPQHHTNRGYKTYIGLVLWLTNLCTVKYPHIPVLLGEGGWGSAGYPLPPL